MTAAAAGVQVVLMASTLRRDLKNSSSTRPAGGYLRLPATTQTCGSAAT